MVVKLSIIIPFYNGNKYINETVKSVEKSIDYSLENNELEPDEYEIIIINDSPDVVINLQSHNDKIIIYKNPQNQGIHKSRIIGVNHARGEYVIFLDQDDKLTRTAVYDLLLYAEDDDVVIGNGLVENELGTLSHYTFANKWFGQLATKLYPYALVGNQITSPGQALIRKSSIPTEWKEVYLKNNGADDALLWILILLNERKIKYVDQIVYRHCYTGVNASCDIKTMYESTNEYIRYIMDQKSIKKYTKRMLLFRLKMYKLRLENDRKILVKTILFNMDIFIQWIFFKCVRNICKVL